MCMLLYLCRDVYVHADSWWIWPIFKISGTWDNIISSVCFSVWNMSWLSRSLRKCHNFCFWSCELAEFTLSVPCKFAAHLTIPVAVLLTCWTLLNQIWGGCGLEQLNLWAWQGLVMEKLPWSFYLYDDCGVHFVQVFPPLRLEPKNITLIIGAKFQVTYPVTYHLTTAGTFVLFFISTDHFIRNDVLGYRGLHRVTGLVLTLTFCGCLDHCATAVSGDCCWGTSASEHCAVLYCELRHFFSVIQRPAGSPCAGHNTRGGEGCWCGPTHWGVCCLLSGV